MLCKVIHNDWLRCHDQTRVPLNNLKHPNANKRKNRWKSYYLWPKTRYLRGPAVVACSFAYQYSLYYDRSTGPRTESRIRRHYVVENFAGRIEKFDGCIIRFIYLRILCFRESRYRPSGSEDQKAFSLSVARTKLLSGEIVPFKKFRQVWKNVDLIPPNEDRSQKIKTRTLCRYTDHCEYFTHTLTIWKMYST